MSAEEKWCLSLLWQGILTQYMWQSQATIAWLSRALPNWPGDFQVILKFRSASFGWLLQYFALKLKHLCRVASPKSNFIYREQIVAFLQRSLLLSEDEQGSLCLSNVNHWTTDIKHNTTATINQVLMNFSECFKRCVYSVCIVQMLQYTINLIDIYL